MIEATCIKQFRDIKDKNVIEYRLQDTLGNIKDVSSEQLKAVIKQNKIHISNLKLARNNRIVCTDEKLNNVVYINKRIMDKINSRNKYKAVYFKSNVNIEQMQKKAQLLGSELEQFSKWLYKLETDTSIGIISNRQITLSMDAYLLFCDWNCTSLDISEIDASNAVSMKDMFSGCKAKSINFGNFDTSRVTDMSYMFAHIINIEEFKIQNFDTSRVIDMSHMFADSHFIRIDLTNFNTSNVKDMGFMFEFCTSEIIGLNNLDVSNVEKTNSMFDNYKYNSIDISGLNFKSLNSASYMFNKCESEKINLGNIDFERVNTNLMIKDCDSEIITTNKWLQDRLDPTSKEGSKLRRW